ncbi:MAG: tetratricopeptide repeat protein [Burkholderiales bacterium]|nr:tetratricopeptide repeat protein [Burkholderiales bacterium]
MPKPTSGGEHVPAQWDSAAHALWQQGQRQEAINAVLAVINRAPEVKPVDLVLQLAYYVFLVGDPGAAARFLQRARAQHPKHFEVLINLAACLHRTGRFAESLACADEALVLRPDDIRVLDTRCTVLARLGRHAEASEAGSRVLQLKDETTSPPDPAWRLPDATVADWVAMPGKRPVIAFSLWGDKPRYLRGALDNMLGAARIYPGWHAVFFVDDTLPAETRSQLQELGAELRVESPGQTTRQKLAWRFKIANDPTVGRFLVRDVDSVVNDRERLAVDEWLASGRWFHVMRDWWTHSELVLAGMWGGVAGVLPDLTAMLDAYRPGFAETPNVDQWFLRDRVWGYLRTSCLVHDRCFQPPGAQPWPGPLPEGNLHVGQDEYAVRRQQQDERIARRFPAAAQ